MLVWAADTFQCENASNHKPVFMLVTSEGGQLPETQFQHTVPETNKSAPSQSSPLAWARAGSNSKPQWSKLRNGCPTFDGFRPAATSHQSGSKLFIHPFASLARPPRQSSSGYGQVNASKFPHSLVLYAFDLKLKTESKTHVMSQTW